MSRNKKTDSSNFSDDIVKWVKKDLKNYELFLEMMVELAMAEGDPIEEEQVAERIDKQLKKLIYKENKER